MLVTSLAEVWIEMYLPHTPLPSEHRHFPRGSVDWNTKASMIGVGEAVTSFAEVWIEIYIEPAINILYSHFPRGSVDWNLHLLSLVS